MKIMTLNINPSTNVTIRVSGDLFLAGSEDDLLNATSRRDNTLNIQQFNNQILITCLDDCTITLPKYTSVVVEKVGGDAQLRRMQTSLKIHKVGGDLSLQELNEVEVDQIGGDCFTDQITGPLTIQNIGGELNGLRIGGQLSILRVGDDVDIRDTSAGVAIHSGGDIRLGLAKTGDEAIQLKAGGDIYFYLPKEADAAVSMISRGQDITIQTQGQSQVIDARAYQLKLGNGSQNVNLEAGGDVLVSDLPMGNKRVVEKSSKISEKWQRMDDRISARMRNTFDEVDRKIEQAERVTKEAQATLEKAGKRIQAAMEDLGRRSPEGWVNIPESVIFIPPIPSINSEAIKITIPTIKFPQGPNQPAAEEKATAGEVKTPQAPERGETPSDFGVSDEERLLILRMLQEKKINVDQAEELLRALEGQDEE
jgi:hypothetical protein